MSPEFEAGHGGGGGPTNAEHREANVHPDPAGVRASTSTRCASRFTAYTERMHAWIEW